MFFKLGQMIQLSQKLVTGGGLVFFPSYEMVSKARTIWQEQGLLRELQRDKSLYFESKNPDELKDVIRDFEIDTTRADSPSSGIIKRYLQ